MNRPQLAKKLVSSRSDREARRLLKANACLTDAELAREIKDLCYRAWTSEPAAAQRAARALRSLEHCNPDAETAALSRWVAGIAEITKGKLEAAVGSLGEASRKFRSIGREHESAQPLVAALIALGMLGRYAEAKVTGRKALRIFEKYGDDLAAGKIEMNLSNVVSRLGKHHEAEKYCLSALGRFTKAGEPQWRAMAENGLANTYSELNDFAKAERYYRASLSTAKRAGMTLTAAEIEASLGNMALMRGRLDEAVRYFERSRQMYETLKMPHQTAIAEMEIASIYAELNLADEAVGLYRRAAIKFRRLNLTEEEARSRLGLARVNAKRLEFGKARRELDRSSALFARKGNRAGEAAAALQRAFLELAQGKPQVAAATLTGQRKKLRTFEDRRLSVATDFVEASAASETGDRKAESRLIEVTKEAGRMEFREVSIAGADSLGTLAASRGDLPTAEKWFRDAIGKIEDSRGRLQADEFRVGYLAANVGPYERLVDVLVRQGAIENAFLANERFRARSLAEADSHVSNRSRTQLAKEAEAVREELNWSYRRMAETDGLAGTHGKRAAKLEKRLVELERKLASVRKSRRSVEMNLNVGQLFRSLKPGTILIEYFEREGMISAFAVRDGEIALVDLAASTADVRKLLEQLHFQFGTLRYGGEALRPFASGLRSRVDDVLKALGERLLGPLRESLHGSRLVIVPVGVLNYVPFAALYDGERYLAEQFTISIAPSAAVWLKLSKRKSRPVKIALLMARADASIPLVEAEVDAVADVFPRRDVFKGDEATFARFRSSAEGPDVIHLACHGTFRPDNPDFSSLHLADGNVTAGDVAKMRIGAELVTLSACETGLSKVHAGNETLGFVRAFLRAGAGSLVASLWNINDRTTAELMVHFYSGLQRGGSVAASLSRAQNKLIERGENPYHWAPFFAVE